MSLPPELLCMVKSNLNNYDLYRIELTSTKIHDARVPRREWQLRRCKLWNLQKLSSPFCGHLICWEHRSKFLVASEIVETNIVSGISPLVWAAKNNHLSVVQFLCESYFLSSDLVYPSLYCAADFENVEILEYFFQKFEWSESQIRQIFWRISEKGDLCKIRVTCNLIEKYFDFSDIIFNVAMENGNLQLVEYLCRRNNFSRDMIRRAFERHRCTGVTYLRMTLQYGFFDLFVSDIFIWFLALSGATAMLPFVIFFSIFGMLLGCCMLPVAL
jgi:hypothetical protein